MTELAYGIAFLMVFSGVVFKLMEHLSRVAKEIKPSIDAEEIMRQDIEALIESLQRDAIRRIDASIDKLRR